MQYLALGIGIVATMWAAVPLVLFAADERVAPACTDYVAKVEINMYGVGPMKIAVIYRDEQGNIIDWRVYIPKSAMVPTALGDGRFIAVWKDGDVMRTVIAGEVVYVRSQEDRELMERGKLPVAQRRKLSPCPKPSLTPAVMVPAGNALIPPPLPAPDPK